jgi:hypothetical protein
VISPSEKCVGISPLGTAGNLRHPANPVASRKRGLTCLRCLLMSSSILPFLMFLAFCRYDVQSYGKNESVYNPTFLLSPLLPHCAMVKYKWCTCQRLCNGSAEVHKRSYLKHQKYRDVDCTRRREHFAERYGTFDVNPHIRQAVTKAKRKKVR